MGGPWLRYNHMTERTDIFMVIHKKRFVFEKCWSLYQRSRDDDGQESIAATGAPAETPSTQTEVSTAPPPQPMASPAARSSDEMSVTTSGGSSLLIQTPPPQQAGEPEESTTSGKRCKRAAEAQSSSGEDREQKRARLDTARRAQRLRQDYLTVIGVQQRIERNVDTDPAYVWAANSNTLKNLQRLKDDLEERISKDPFVQVFLSASLSEVKKRHDAAAFQTGIKGVLALTDAVSVLTTEHRRFERMHAVTTADA